MRLLTFICSLLIISLSDNSLAGIVNTKHNLSSTSAAAIKATDGEQEICIFCHTPHNSNPIAPLWNRNSNGNFYTPYDSTTFSIDTPGTPTGSSLLCLSCHDGTIALGDIFSRPDITLNQTYIPAGSTRLGNDLSDDHPVSFNYSTAAALNSELEAASTLTNEVKLDDNGEMQCTSCHDPHTEANPKFLVKSNIASALCITCHKKDYWTETSHSIEAATWNGTLPDPWPHTEESTVANNGCENCHKPHTAGNAERILNYAVEETNCLVCHNGNIDNPAAIQNIEAEFSKFSTHPITLTQGIHDAAENNVVGTKHVECFDCHNPHAANATSPLNGARGVNINGTDITAINYPQEVCYRCHGDSSDTHAPSGITSRQFVQTNTRLEHNSGNSMSYHPVASPIGNSTTVPSLITGSIPLTLGGTVEHGGTISCTDCHNNDQNPNNGAGGTGPSGPHGSANARLLERNYSTIDETTESATQYAMCYKCHDRDSLLNNDLIAGYESFPRHDFHITGTGAAPTRNMSTPCNVCHDPHASGSQKKLVNFDTSIVTPNGTLEFKYDAVNGQCTLSCHGQDHSPCGYDRSTGKICGNCDGNSDNGNANAGGSGSGPGPSTCPVIP